MATHRLPTPGSDNGTWGDILNDFLVQAHNTDGSLQDSIITDAKISSSAAIAKTKLASAVQTSLTSADTAYQKPGSGIPKTDMATAVQTSLTSADNAAPKPSAGADGKVVKWNNTSGALEDASTTLNATYGWFTNPKNPAYGAKGDGAQTNDGVISSSSAVLTSAHAPWTSADVGKPITIIGAGTSGATLATTILSYQSAGQVTLATTAATTVASGGLVTWGTDDTAAVIAAVAAAATKGGQVVFPPGIYILTAQITVPGGVTLVGNGFDYSDPTTSAPHLCAVLMAGAAMAVMVMLGPFGSGGQSLAGYTGAHLENLSLDGRSIATAVVQTQGRRGELRNCQVYWGASYAVQFFGQNNYIRGGVYCQQDLGDVLCISGGGDHKILDAQLRQPGTTGAAIRVVVSTSVDDILIRGCHMWTGGNGVAKTAQGLIVLDGLSAPAATVLANVNITGNIIEGIIGTEIVINLGTGADLRSIAITNNTFFNANTDNATTDVVKINGTGTIGTFIMANNIIDGAGAALKYNALLEFTGPPASSGRFLLVNNVGTYVTHILIGTPPTAIYMRGNAIRNFTTTAYSDAGGKATFSGTGSQTAFVIPHTLDGTPTTVRVTPASAVAAALYYITVDGTNITVNFVVAPASGASNVLLYWSANIGL
jgi:hypothetical protein